jgi:hypothetical protein
VIALGVAAELGFRLSRYKQRRSPDDSEASVATIDAATLAVFGFLLAIVANSSMNVFVSRRAALVEEANAIGTTYLRAGTLPDPYGADSRRLLREYVGVRIESMRVSDMAAAIARSEHIQSELWARAEAAVREAPTPTTSLYLASLNEVIDMHTERVSVGLLFGVPPTVVFTLVALGFLALMVVGLHAGYAEARNLIALFTLIVSLAAVLTLIVDLGRGQEGLLRVPQQALIDLQRQLR